MRLMRIGPAGGERPVVRLDDETYVDVSDEVGDYDAAYFSGGHDRLRAKPCSWLHVVLVLVDHQAERELRRRRFGEIPRRRLPEPEQRRHSVADDRTGGPAEQFFCRGFGIGDAVAELRIPVAPA